MSVERWISRLNAPKTKKDYAYIFSRFETWRAEHGGKFKDMTPDELVAYQRNCSNGDCFEIIEVAQDWILSFTGLRYASKKLYYAAVKSFFMYNRAPLPKDATFNISSDVQTVPSKLRPEHIKKVVLASTPMYQALFLSMLEGALGLAEVMYWNENGWPSLQRQLEEGVDVVKVDLPGRKKSRNKRTYYTLVGGDALRALKGYIGDDLDPERPTIFINVYSEPLKREAINAYWRRMLKRLGIITPITGMSQKETGKIRYGYGLHEMRDNFRTLWARSTANLDIGEFCMGHKIDPLGYNQIFRDEEYAKDEYRKALHYLNIVSGDLDLEESLRLRQLEQENQQLQEQLKKLTWEVESIKALRHNLATDVLNEREWVQQNALAIIKQTARAPRFQSFRMTASIQ